LLKKHGSKPAAASAPANAPGPGAAPVAIAAAPTPANDVAPVPPPMSLAPPPNAATTAAALKRLRYEDVAEVRRPRDTHKLSEAELFESFRKFGALSPGVTADKLFIIRYGRKFRGMEPLNGELRYGRERELVELPQWLSEVEPLLAEGFIRVYNEDGRKKQPQILDEYSTLLPGSIVYDLTISESHYDTSTGDFRVAAAPFRPLTPEFNPQIDQWLDLLGGAQAHALKSWIAALTLLQRPSAAPFLIGDSGTGKSLLIEGLAKLWAAGAATPLDALVDGTFNGAIARCPFIAADEEFPPGFRSTKLRRWTGSSVQDLHEKYQERASLHGALRFIFAANKANALRFTDQLGRDDLGAVALRFIFIDVDERPAKFLKSIGGREATEAWVDGCGIAKHALWLRDNYRFTPGQRLIVEGAEITRAHRALIVNGVVAEQVATAIAKFLNDPSQFDRLLSDGTFIVGAGKVLVNGQGMLDAWKSALFQGGDRVAPLLDAINSALSNFSLSKTHARRTAPNGQTRRYWDINPDAVIEFAERNQIGDPDALRARVAGPLVGRSKPRPFASIGTVGGPS
jgi:hypothetical protein